jgi:hypothetical protein
MAEVICVVPVAPIRAEGSHRAEMVSQILFCETATIIHETKDFYQIQMHQDGYEGWCQKLQLQLLPGGASIITNGMVQVVGHTHMETITNDGSCVFIDCLGSEANFYIFEGN